MLFDKGGCLAKNTDGSRVSFWQSENCKGKKDNFSTFAVLIGDLRFCGSELLGRQWSLRESVWLWNDKVCSWWPVCQLGRNQVSGQVVSPRGVSLLQVQQQVRCVGVRDPDVGSVQPGEAAIWLVWQLPGGCEGLPGPQTLPAPTGIGHHLPDHVQLLARASRKASHISATPSFHWTTSGKRQTVKKKLGDLMRTNVNAGQHLHSF